MLRVRMYSSLVEIVYIVGIPIYVMNKEMEVISVLYASYYIELNKFTGHYDTFLSLPSWVCALMACALF